MCGIVGAVAKRCVENILMEGLRRLEYRGYDSAGIALLDTQDHLLRERTKGKVHELELALQKNHLSGFTGIAHTRWATHGEPATHNAHPHISRDVIALVHNGIIENHEALRTQLSAQGYECSSDTDSELIAHLIHQKSSTGLSFVDAVRASTQELAGAFALGVISQDEPSRLIAVRQGSPLVIGIGEDEHFIASDHIALLGEVSQFIYLQEGDLADIRSNQVTIYDANGDVVTRPIRTPDVHLDRAEKGEYRHFMKKEIFEQGAAIAATIENRLGQDKVLTQALGANADVLEKVNAIQIVACGTSFHAGLVAKYWLEAMAGIPVQVEVASEFRYRDTVSTDKTLFITISQSGETADTIAALRKAKESNYLATLAICNRPESTLVRESDLIFMTRAGVEVGVASTKAFTTQLVALFLITIVLARHHGLSAEKESELVAQLKQLPEYIENLLALDASIETLAAEFADKENALFLGRGIEYPVAMEGALKLKEISYIHAEAYPAGELKHGPLALVDDKMPVVVVAPNDTLIEKLKSNLREVQARGGKLYVFADDKLTFGQQDNVSHIDIPSTHPLLAPIIYTIPLQLLAYHVAVIRGTDVDQPRNLAKSVTVE